MKFFTECKDCLLKSQIKKISCERTPKERDAFLAACEALVSDRPAKYCAPLLMYDMDKKYREMFSKGIDYTAEKKLSNDIMLSFEKQIEAAIYASHDPLYEAVKFSMAANYIDFARLSSFEKGAESEVFKAQKKAAPDMRTYNMLKKDLSFCKNLTLICDNCGEVVLDKILLKTIRSIFPNMRIYALVRGGDIINDVTYSDAKYVSLNEIAVVIPLRQAIPGLDIQGEDENTLSFLKNSDVVISKGLGNLETLSGEGYKIYYMFMCKCSHMAERFHKNLLDTVLYLEG